MQILIVALAFAFAKADLLVGSGGKFFFQQPKKQKPVGEFEVQKSLGTISGLRCPTLEAPTATKMVCTKENAEDSVCTILCHKTKSGLGMGSQVCACAKMFKGPVMIPLGCKWKGNYPDCDESGEAAIEEVKTTTKTTTTTTTKAPTTTKKTTKATTTRSTTTTTELVFEEETTERLTTAELPGETTESTEEPNLMLMRGMNRFISWPPGILDDEPVDDEPTTTSTTTTTTTSTELPTTTTERHRFQGFNTDTGLDRGSAKRENLQSFIDSNRPAWADEIEESTEEPTETTERPAAANEAAASMEIERGEDGELEPDEPLILKQETENKDPITFHPQAVKATLENLEGLTDTDLELINRFVQKYKTQILRAETEEDGIALLSDDDEPDEKLVFTTFDGDVEEMVDQTIDSSRSELLMIGEDDDGFSAKTFASTTTERPTRKPKTAKVNMERSCENLHPPKNGFLQYSDGLNAGSIVTYSCIKGYEVRQRGPVRKCTCSGNKCSWTKKPRLCDQMPLSSVDAQSILSTNLAIAKNDRLNRREERKKERAREKERERNERLGRKDNKLRVEDEGPVVAPMSSWARSLGGGARLSAGELAHYFTEDGSDHGRNDFYKPQGYHHTPTALARTTESRVIATDCPALTLEHGQIFCTQGYRDGSRCTYSCKRGYVLAFVGRVVRCSCTSDGCYWNKPPQQCTLR